MTASRTFEDSNDRMANGAIRKTAVTAAVATRAMKSATRMVFLYDYVRCVGVSLLLSRRFPVPEGAQVFVEPPLGWVCLRPIAEMHSQ